MTITRPGCVQGGKWCGLKLFLHEVAWDTGVSLRITDRDGGLLMERLYYEITGTPEQVQRFGTMLEASIEAHNAQGDANATKP